MAKMIPPDPPVSGPMSERTVYDALSRLDDGWTILHSVQWQSLRNGRQGDGEADFLLIHKSRGILVLEVKGGDINLSNGVWTSTNSNTGQVVRIKNPFDQATASKHALRSYLDSNGVPTQQISFAHAVAFPRRTIGTDVDLGPAATPAIVWDRRLLDDPATAVEGTAKHWGMRASLANEDLKKIVQLLAPTTTIRRRLVDRLGTVSQQLIRLTEEQIQDFALLKSFRRALVLGGAGTGKTILAVARARQLAEDGFSPILVCYNERLGQRLAAEVADDDRIWAGTFHSLCLKSAHDAGIVVPKNPPSEFWTNEAPQLLIDAFARRSKGYNSVVVDEGQDFPQPWFDALELVISDIPDPPLYVFADAHQQLYLKGWSLPANMPPALHLTVNCRSTNPIAARAADVFGERATGRGTDGPAPQFRDVPNRRDLLRGIQRLAETLVDTEGVAPSSIVVLVDEPDLLSGLTAMAAGSVPFVRAGNGIEVETIRRFKGLESEVIILALSERTAPDALPAIAYTGISRAKSALYVFGTSELRHRIGWRG